jgi:hypothetical protein
MKTSEIKRYTGSKYTGYLRFIERSMQNNEIKTKTLSLLSEEGLKASVQEVTMVRNDKTA